VRFVIVVVVRNGSEAFTRAKFQDGSTETGRTEIWYLVNPTATTASVVTTWDASTTRRGAGVYSFYNVKQTSPIGVTADDDGTATVTTSTITPTTAGSMIVDVIGSGSNGAPVDTLTAGWTQLIGGDDRIHSSQYNLTPTISSANNMFWTFVSAKGVNWIAVEVKAFAGEDYSDLPENTIFEETDTHRSYFLQDNTGISKAGCLGFWTFQEQSGDVINQATTANGFADGLGSAADGTVDGTIDRTATGKFRTYAYVFDDSSSEKVAVDDQSGLDITGDITLTAWLYPTEDGSNNREFFTKRTGSDINYQFYGRGSSGTLNVAFYDGELYSTTTTNLSRNAWHFVACTIGSNTIKIYVDNIEQTVSPTSIPTRTANSAKLVFGSHDGGSAGEAYAGRMQDATIWNRALSATELSAMYNSGRGVFDMVSGVGWYR